MKNIKRAMALILAMIFMFSMTALAEDANANGEAPQMGDMGGEPPTGERPEGMPGQPPEGMGNPPEGMGQPPEGGMPGGPGAVRATLKKYLDQLA